MSTESTTIRTVRNAGYMSIIVSCTDHFERELARGASAEVDVQLVPDVRIELNLFTLGARNNPQTVWLWYTVERGKNQFYYDLRNESKGPQPVPYATNPDANVSLDIGYSGDGVVVVGTGDML